MLFYSSGKGLLASIKSSASVFETIPRPLQEGHGFTTGLSLSLIVEHTTQICSPVPKQVGHSSTIMLIDCNYLKYQQYLYIALCSNHNLFHILQIFYLHKY